MFSIDKWNALSIYLTLTNFYEALKFYSIKIILKNDPSSNVGHSISIKAFYSVCGTFRVQISNLPNAKKGEYSQQTLALSLS